MAGSSPLRADTSVVPGACGLQILIDGDYARDRQGTGISTYARTLAKGLTALDHGVALAVRRKRRRQERSTGGCRCGFRRTKPARGPRAWAQTATRMAGGLMSGSVLAREISVAMSSWPPSGEAETGHPPGARTVRPGALSPHAGAAVHRGKVSSAPSTSCTSHAPLPVRMKGVKRVVTIHDLIPIRLPYTTPDNKAEFSRACANLCSRKRSCR